MTPSTIRGGLRLLYVAAEFVNMTAWHQTLTKELVARPIPTPVTAADAQPRTGRGRGEQCHLRAERSGQRRLDQGLHRSFRCR